MWLCCDFALVYYMSETSSKLCVPHTNLKWNSWLTQNAYSTFILHKQQNKYKTLFVQYSLSIKTNYRSESQMTWNLGRVSRSKFSIRFRWGATWYSPSHAHWKIQNYLIMLLKYIIVFLVIKTTRSRSACKQGYWYKSKSACRWFVRRLWWIQFLTVRDGVTKVTSVLIGWDPAGWQKKRGMVMWIPVKRMIFPKQ